MTAKSDLEHLLTRKRLRGLAGEVWFDRGEAYWADGRVRSLRCEGDKVSAQVSGTHPYKVRIWADDDELGYSCTCPLGEDGGCCKHCVATGLAWLAQRPGDRAPENDIRSYLAGRPVNELVDVIMARAEADESFHQQLALRAARNRKQPGNRDLKPWKQAFDDAVEADDYIEYRAAGSYAAGIDEVIDSVQELLDDGDADAVVELAEYGLEAVEDAIGLVDDSDGEMGGLLHRLQDLHLAACSRSKPDPEALARRLFEWELLGQWDVFHGAVSDYAEILGEKGLAVYRALAEAEWKNVPALKPGSKADRFGKRFHITHIMEALARRTGDVDALVEIKRRDLSLPYDFLQIAEAYKEAGRNDDALLWAERGWHAFAAAGQDDRLREFLADAYHERQRHDEATELIWEGFATRQELETYRSLNRHAKQANDWPRWRERVLASIRERVAATASGVRPRGVRDIWALPRSDSSLLVEIFLWERKPDDAWREAKEGGCSSSLWLQLAAKREKSHPRDALAVYRDHIPKTLSQTDNRAYQEAIVLLRKIRGLYVAVDEEKKFRPYIAELRSLYNRKRNFIKLLDREGW